MHDGSACALGLAVAGIVKADLATAVLAGPRLLGRIFAKNGLTAGTTDLVHHVPPAQNKISTRVRESRCEA